MTNVAQTEEVVKFVAQKPLHSAFVDVMVTPSDCGKWVAKGMTIDRAPFLFDVEIVTKGAVSYLEASSLRDMDGTLIRDIDHNLAKRLVTAVNKWADFHAGRIIGRVCLLSMDGAYDTVGGIGYLPDADHTPYAKAA